MRLAGDDAIVIVPAAPERIRKAGLAGGLQLECYYPELPDGLLLCVTELHDRKRIDALVQALA